MTLRELSDRMSCEPSNATFIADKLEQRSLIERHAHPQDRTRVRPLLPDKRLFRKSGPGRRRRLPE
ncbi:MarR family transcriptional regulator [Nonomuraea sp. NPDC049269]|uniref:MarR family transcriptional regulator n=1 Tax=Nonomuraea sp. NPDC049269 TaxID=3364349 RepID=UPI00371DB3D5